MINQYSGFLFGILDSEILLVLVLVLVTGFLSVDIMGTGFDSCKLKFHDS